MTDTKPKLTKAQRETLELLSDGPQGYACYYPPIKRLLGMGLIEETRGRFCDLYQITPAGREALR